MTFEADEVEFLRSHGIARLATVGAEDQPDVEPAPQRVALVVDHLPSFDPGTGS